MEDIAKPLMAAVVGAFCIVLAVYTIVYLVLPVGAIALGYAGYAYWRDHPNTQANRLRAKAELLYNSVKHRRLDFSSFGSLEPLARELCGDDPISPPPPTGVGSIQLARYVDRLSDLAAQPDSMDLVKRAIRSSIGNLVAAVPSAEDGVFEARALDLVDAPQLVEAVILPFFDADLVRSGALKELRETFERNQHRMSGVPYTIENVQSPKLIMPSKFDGPADKIVRGFLADTPFVRLFESDVLIDIPDKLRYEGMWIVAPPGRGKTTLLSNLLLHDLDKVANGNAAIIVMDSKGDLIDHLKKSAMFAPDGPLEGKITIIEPHPNLALNPLDIGANDDHAISLSEYVLEGLVESDTTPKQGGLFRKILLALRRVPDANFDTFRAFLKDWKPYQEHLLKLDRQEDRDFFMNGDYDAKSNRETREGLWWRIDALMTKVPLLRDMFRAPRTQINIGEQMDAGRVIIIDNSIAKLSTGSAFFSRFFVALVLDAAQQRAERADADKLACYFYIDECDTVISNDDTVAEILQRCRSQKIGMVLAHQEIAQINSKRVRGALANCAIRMANPDDEAPALAQSLRMKVDDLRSLKRGEFALYMRDRTPHGLAVRIPPQHISEWDKMSAIDYEAIEDDMMRRYSYLPAPVAPPPVIKPEPPSSDKPANWA